MVHYFNCSAIYLAGFIFSDLSYVGKFDIILYIRPFFPLLFCFIRLKNNGQKDFLVIEQQLRNRTLTVKLKVEMLQHNLIGLKNKEIKRALEMIRMVYLMR